MSHQPRTFPSIQAAVTHYRRWRMRHEWPVMIDGKRYLLTQHGPILQDDRADLTVEVRVR